MKSIKEKVLERRKKQAFDRANRLFQVKEHCGEVWLTFADNPICPMSFFKDRDMDVLTRIRAMYVVENT